MTNIRRTRQSAPLRLSRHAAYPRTHTVSETKPVARIQISLSSNGQLSPPNLSPLKLNPFTPSPSPYPQWVACQGSVVTTIFGRAGCGCSDFHSVWTPRHHVRPAAPVRD